jgi:hypothetical protein
LLAASTDGVATVLDAPSGRELLRFNLAGESLVASTWSHDGQSVYFGGSDSTVHARTADPWQLDQLPGDTDEDWQARYAAFKEHRALAPSPGAQRPGVHLVTAPESAVRERLRRWAKLCERDDGNTALPTVDTKFVYPVVRKLGFLPGDVLMGVNGNVVSDRQSASRLLREAAESEDLPESIRFARNRNERTVTFSYREPDLTKISTTMPREFARRVVDVLPQVRPFIPFITMQQRGLSELIDLPLERNGIDGMWVMTAVEDLGNTQQAYWAKTMNEFFRMVGLYDVDRITSLNGVQLDSVEDLFKAILDGGDPIRSGEPFTYVAEVDRSEFERIELSIHVVDEPISP